MRRKFLAANWKMNTKVEEGLRLAKQIHHEVKVFQDIEIVLFPPYTHIFPVSTAISDSYVSVGAQDCSIHEKGAYTGEVSASMLASAGARYVIIGHSERRQYHNENEATCVLKIKSSIQNGLVPIYCFGETLEERSKNEHFKVIENQILKVLKEVFHQDLILAYEPVWAIGTGRTATPEQANEIHKFVRGLVAEQCSTEAANTIRMIYGGSVKAENALEIFSESDIDGALVGGASLNVSDFTSIASQLHSTI
jgi:triosephosphate isomerase